MSFGVGTVLLLLAAALMPSVRRGLGQLWASARAGTTPWWVVLGGFVGATVVAS